MPETSVITAVRATSDRIRLEYWLFAGVAACYLLGWGLFRENGFDIFQTAGKSTPLLLNFLNMHLTIPATLFAGISFISIRQFLWKNRMEVPADNQLEGLFWLTATMWLWAVASLQGLFFLREASIWAKIADSLVSALNSVTMLLALRFIDQRGRMFNTWLFRRLRINAARYTRFIAWVYGLFFAGDVLFKYLAQGETGNSLLKILSETLLVVPDLLLFCPLLAIVLRQTFVERKLPLVGAMTTFSILTLALSQVLTAIFHALDGKASLELSFWVTFSLLGYKILLIMIFLAESFLWLWGQKNRLLELQRQDMNHSIRGSLDTLYFDLRKYEKSAGEAQPVLREVYQDLRVRVGLISKLHNLMVKNKMTDAVDLELFLHEIAAILAESQGLPPGAIRTDIQLPAFRSVPAFRADLIGASMLELCLNAFKAYRDVPVEKRILHISAQTQGPNLLIGVRDQGPGYDSEANRQATNGGTKYLNQAIRDTLHGTWAAKSQPQGGTLATITIPITNIL
ncbi:MAG: sensor histidine kinase [Saprospiraceae bacterium]|nr:sensor histidine kinase [Saprospiraceae bacterium]